MSRGDTEPETRDVSLEGPERDVNHGRLQNWDSSEIFSSEPEQRRTTVEQTDAPEQSRTTVGHTDEPEQRRTTVGHTDELEQRRTTVDRTDEPEHSRTTVEHTDEPEHSRTTVEHTDSLTKKMSDCDRAGPEISDHSTSDVSTNENRCLIPKNASTPNHTLTAEDAERGCPASFLQNGHAPSSSLPNGTLPICTPPTVAPRRPEWQQPKPHKCNGEVSRKKKRLPSTSTNSQNSLKTTAAQIQQASGDDCCVHCVLACLFCELLSLCSVVAQCLACGRGCEALCCCGGGATGGTACGEEACSSGLDCGIVEDCCGSSDCLEICLECCSICFPA
ncbi:hypothetical protein GJAV_G00189540 [Gymnothorax javanicus]|nr:hypothetical protein GJAV_G00189540 [Gymnothorax javanicus]